MYIAEPDKIREAVLSVDLLVDSLDKCYVEQLCKFVFGYTAK